MKTAICLSACLLCAWPVLGGEKGALSSGVSVPTIRFKERIYKLAFVEDTNKLGHRQLFNEYIPPGETLERWTKLIAVYAYPTMRDHESMVAELVKSIQQHNPLARYALFRSPDGNRLMVDFITWDLKHEITEFNVFIYQRDPDGNGVLAQQFAMRIYGKGFEDFMIKLKGDRPQILTDVTSFEFPRITLQQPLSE